MTIRFGVAMTLDMIEKSDISELVEAGLEVIEIGLIDSIPQSLSSKLEKELDVFSLIPTFHLPFSINLLNPKQVHRSCQVLEQGFHLANHYSSISVFHAGFYSDSFVGSAADRISLLIRSVLDTRLATGSLGIETTGKKTEFGTIDEVLQVVEKTSHSSLVPVVDWAHIYARSYGRFPLQRKDYANILDNMKSLNIPDNFHFHIAGMDHNNGNERRHKSITECLPPLPYLIDVLHNMVTNATIILETPSPLEDLKWASWARENISESCQFADSRIRDFGGYTASLLDF